MPSEDVERRYLVLLRIGPWPHLLSLQVNQKKGNGRSKLTTAEFARSSFG